MSAAADLLPLLDQIDKITNLLRTRLDPEMVTVKQHPSVMVFDVYTTADMARLIADAAVELVNASADLL